MTDATPHFDIESSTPRDLRLVGELDAHASQRLDVELDDTPDGDVRVDLSGVTYLDSSGLRWLIVRHQRLAATDHRLVIVSPSATATRLFELSDVGGYLEIEP